jgi:activator of 2-hydroxyglutaryl-CoA dehydratase
VCTVFAESEVVGLLNRNISRKNIARALHKTITKKAITYQSVLTAWLPSPKKPRFSTGLLFLILTKAAKLCYIP